MDAASTDLVEQQSQSTALAEHLGQSQFFQMVHLIGVLHSDLSRMGPGEDPSSEPIRFRSTRSLSFGPSDVSQINYNAAENRFDIRVNFMGLYGPASPMPPYVTERIIERDETPSSLEDLLDLFNHRLITLLFQIWQKSRHHIRYQSHGLDETSKCILALCGFPIEDRTQIGSVDRSALLPHVGLISLYSSSAAAVSSVLTRFFQVRCEIVEYVSRKVQLGVGARMALGIQNTRLGEDVVIGETVQDDLGKFMVRLGPAEFDHLRPFLPGGERHPEIGELLSMVVSDPLDWDIEFNIEPETIEPAVVGTTRLGVSTWLSNGVAELVENSICIAPGIDVAKEMREVAG